MNNKLITSFKAFSNMKNITENGKVFTCLKCNKIHIEFNNLNFSFSEIEYKSFKEYVLKLNGEKWEAINNDSVFERKIHISILNNSFSIVLHNYELEEFKNLLNGDSDTEQEFYFIKNENFSQKQGLN